MLAIAFCEIIVFHQETRATTLNSAVDANFIVNLRLYQH